MVYDRVNYVSFSRNFGKEAALYAGLKDKVMIMVLRTRSSDPPELLVQMKSILDEDEDIGLGSYRVNRGENHLSVRFLQNYFIESLINQSVEYC